MKDIERVYSNEESLVSALKQDKVPLRDDIVLKLQKFYGIK